MKKIKKCKDKNKKPRLSKHGKERFCGFQWLGGASTISFLTKLVSEYQVLKFQI